MKAVLVPIYRKDEEKAQVLEAAHRIAKDVGAKVDDREGQSPGAKFFHWERRGVPVVLELGPRDLAAGKIVLKRRDTGTKEPIAAGRARGASCRRRWTQMQTRPVRRARSSA